MEPPRDKKNLIEVVYHFLTLRGLSYCRTRQTKTTHRLRYHPQDKTGFRIIAEFDPLDESTGERRAGYYVAVYTARGRMSDLVLIRDTLAEAGVPVTISRTRWRKSKRVYILWPLDEYDRVVSTEDHEPT